LTGPDVPPRLGRQALLALVRLVRGRLDEGPDRVGAARLDDDGARPAVPAGSVAGADRAASAGRRGRTPGGNKR
jgi:hypothetical protein